VKKILALHTGGTISMHEDASGKVVPDVENPITKAQFALPDDVELTSEDIFNLPSPHVTPEHMLLLKNRIEKAVREEDFFGVVITHGTDTLEETAFFLDTTVMDLCPIVLTGAMRSSNELGSDGLYNYLSAIRVASCDDSFGKGVVVVMNDEVHSARFVTKTHTTNVATFRTPTHGPIGLITKHKVMYFNKLLEHSKAKIEKVDSKIPIIKAYAGMDSTTFEVLSHMNIDGLVVEALGSGNLPPYTLEGLQKVIDKDIPIVVVSRCFNGVAEPVYAYEGGGVNLEKMGLIFANGINSQKARLKLLIALNAGMSGIEIDEFIAE
jgi:L-asparaginase